jgi:hypothetical protein
LISSIANHGAITVGIGHKEEEQLGLLSSLDSWIDAMIWAKVGRGDECSPGSVLSASALPS